MKTYNGHRSWNAWNVSLWIGSDEGLYKFAMECIETAKKASLKWPKRILNLATTYFMRSFGGDKTPDGATYNRLSVKLALEGFIED